ncbi:MAG: hypothetical protein UX99_C0017G0018 [Candidatus Amesbacteria bacterium GW2011_GWB1_47_26]|uniref:Uncharacterized protein n=1 Tax=Candidatus Amesbacteria bacterium GW2011_GWC2_45_19 TaxID=1618366 RepID=A0A0G1M391_9BACT|nr:MAG: hypothetical protein UX05_C0009G0022 [Candidatus Amesbacteria bacterium GW2011_GWC2_45_19]KKU37819.1 MAG: hypothetical protein UX52_C0017G0006 [Candidatus Amesbacteria bacterium GW2011_GWA1_46_35]KKU69359.1 MAG: hypothetical protein UX93_C0002G0198 [Microgenomates group bacterium GW2011_GWC1_47_20]KKU74337.1 MAG: hypothetical protein UX99_C0017G0018 [Candidatus Amesbacteria bacterium GW2011_GWB1_47_26]KKU79082.1 MAG: hypothetical protein UY06_C0031G0003 [Candidatus Amesbacteria bacteriu
MAENGVETPKSKLDLSGGKALAERERKAAERKGVEPMSAEEAVARMEKAIEAGKTGSKEPEHRGVVDEDVLKEGVAESKGGAEVVEDKSKWTIDRIVSAAATAALAMDEAQELVDKFKIEKDVFSKMVRGVRETIWGKQKESEEEEPKAEGQRAPTAAEIGAAVAEALKQQQAGWEKAEPKPQPEPEVGKAPKEAKREDEWERWEGRSWGQIRTDLDKAVRRGSLGDVPERWLREKNELMEYARRVGMFASPRGEHGDFVEDKIDKVLRERLVGEPLIYGHPDPRIGEWEKMREEMAHLQASRYFEGGGGAGSRFLDMVEAKWGKEARDHMTKVLGGVVEARIQEANDEAVITELSAKDGLVGLTEGEMRNLNGAIVRQAIMNVSGTEIDPRMAEGAKRYAEAMVASGKWKKEETEAASAQYGGVDYMKKSRLEQAALARAAFLTVEKDGDNIYESIPLVPHGEIYYSLTHREAETLAARMALSNARARVQQAVKTEQVFPAPELMSISKAGLESLSSMPGVSEATAIYAALITRPDLMRQYLSQLGLPEKHLLDIAEKTELKTYRETFATYLGERFGLEAQDASNAEAVAYNFCRAFKIPESVDYRFYPEYQRTNRTRLSAVVNDTFRTLLNPAYKMLDAVEKVDGMGNIHSVSRGGRKGWPRNTLGNWIVRNIDDAGGITKVWQKEPLVGNAFCEVDFVDENGQADKLMKAGDDRRMEGALIGAAVELVSKKVDKFHIDWKNAENETPLFLYEFGMIKPAQLIVSMLENLALPKDTTVEQVVKAFGDLGTIRLNSRQTLQLIIAHSERRYELHAHKSNLELAVSGLEKAGYLRGFNMSYPDYFRIGLPKQN